LQTQAPELLHACPLVQPLHAAPPTPQVLVPEVWHLPLLSQQPLGQEVASQMHIPWALQDWFAPQGAQTPPFAPQCWALEATHWSPEQQPAQLIPAQLHAPDEQVWPDVHRPHAVPPVPHAVVPCFAGRTQVVPWQQPPAQEVVVQEQTPAVLQA